MVFYDLTGSGSTENRKNLVGAPKIPVKTDIQLLTDHKCSVAKLLQICGSDLFLMLQ